MPAALAIMIVGGAAPIAAVIGTGCHDPIAAADASIARDGRSSPLDHDGGPAGDGPNAGDAPASGDGPAAPDAPPPTDAGPDTGNEGVIDAPVDARMLDAPPPDSPET